MVVLFFRGCSWDSSYFTSFSITQGKSLCLQMTPNWIASVLKGRATVWRDLRSLKEKAYSNLMKFGKDECSILHLERRSPSHRTDWALTGQGPSVLNPSRQTAVCPGSKEGQWDVSKVAQPTHSGKWLSPSSQCFLDHIWSTVSNFAPLP